jgi:hypothetical protein
MNNTKEKFEKLFNNELSTEEARTFLIFIGNNSPSPMGRDLMLLK